MMAASVGVKMPKTMPPMMMSGVTRVSTPSFAVRRTSPNEKGVRIPNPRRLAMMTQVIICTTPIRTPGMIPAKKSFPSDSPDTKLQSTMGMDGGIIIPMQAEDATNPAANLPEYFCSFMAGIRMLPSAEVSAEDDPLTPPKIMLATTVTAANPPGRKPTRALEKFTIRRVSPPVSMMAPASMKNGMARSTQLRVTGYIRWAMSGMVFIPSNKKRAIAADRASDTAIGTRSRMSTNIRINKASQGSMPPSRNSARVHAGSRR